MYFSLKKIYAVTDMKISDFVMRNGFVSWFSPG